MTHVRNPVTEEVLPCCWDDCWKPGHEEYKMVNRVGDQALHYVFCCQLHRNFYVNSHISYGNTH